MSSLLSHADFVETSRPSERKLGCMGMTE